MPFIGGYEYSLAPIESYAHFLTSSQNCPPFVNIAYKTLPLRNTLQAERDEERDANRQLARALRDLCINSFRDSKMVHEDELLRMVHVNDRFLRQVLKTFAKSAGNGRSVTFL